MADLKMAMELERRQAKSGARLATKDLLNKCCAEYNRLCTLKSHRIDQAKKTMCYNMRLDCTESLTW